jgi:hypothetical protein
MRRVSRLSSRIACELGVKSWRAVATGPKDQQCSLQSTMTA